MQNGYENRQEGLQSQQQLRAMAAFPKDPGLIHCAHSSPRNLTLMDTKHTCGTEFPKQRNNPCVGKGDVTYPHLTIKHCSD